MNIPPIKKVRVVMDITTRVTFEREPDEYDGDDAQRSIESVTYAIGRDFGPEVSAAVAESIAKDYPNAVVTAEGMGRRMVSADVQFGDEVPK